MRTPLQVAGRKKKHGLSKVLWDKDKPTPLSFKHTAQSLHSAHGAGLRLRASTRPL